MLKTHIGYDKAAQIANKAREDGTTLKVRVPAFGHVQTERLDG
ncbi:hypothetical protein [Paraburkholderia xenovorans]